MPFKTETLWIHPVDESVKAAIVEKSLEVSDKQTAPVELIYSATLPTRTMLAVRHWVDQESAQSWNSFVTSFAPAPISSIVVAY
jgi:hypothetical protein